MGKTNWKRLGLGFLAAACVLGSSIGSAHAGSTTVNIRIPAQPVGGTPPPPISVVRMTFETTGISGTTTISVTRNGVSTNVASIPIPSIVPQPIYTGGPSNEDTLSVKLTGGILELKLFPKSRQGGTQCIPDSTTAAQNGDYAITFTDSAGTPAVTSFRLTSYSAPTGAGTTNCSCNSRRRASYAALWNPLPPGTNKGRHPMNVSLVLDHSGSMSSSTNGDPNPAHRRWDTLSWSVEQFVKDWAVVGGVPDVGGTNLEEDALSVVFFDSSVIPSTGAGATWTAPWERPQTATT